MINPTLVYRKTTKGRDEIAARSIRLSSLARNLLIVVAGKQTAGAIIERFSGQGDIDKELVTLVNEGLIEPLQALGRATTEAAPVRAESVPSPAAFPVTNKQLDELRRRLARLAYDAMGPQAEPIVLRMERATSVAELIVAAERCRNAIHATAGAVRSRAFWERVRPLLGLPSD